jgi:hypothetical protein
MNGFGFDFESLQRRAKREGKTFQQFIVMAPASDPFAAAAPGRERDAEWFAGLWRRHDWGSRVHLRRIHYVLVSSTVILMPRGKPYENTHACWGKLLQAGRDARYLGLLPPGVQIIDARNSEPVCYLARPGASEQVVADGEVFKKKSPGKLPTLPRLVVTKPTIPQRYHIEIWAEN